MASRKTHLTRKSPAAELYRYYVEEYERKASYIAQKYGADMLSSKHKNASDFETVFTAYQNTAEYRKYGAERMIQTMVSRQATKISLKQAKEIKESIVKGKTRYTKGKREEYARKSAEVLRYSKPFWEEVGEDYHEIKNKEIKRLIKEGFAEKEAKKQATIVAKEKVSKIYFYPHYPKRG